MFQIILVLHASTIHILVKKLALDFVADEHPTRQIYIKVNKIQPLNTDFKKQLS